MKVSEREREREIERERAKLYYFEKKLRRELFSFIFNFNCEEIIVN